MSLRKFQPLCRAVRQVNVGNGVMHTVTVGSVLVDEYAVAHRPILETPVQVHMPTDGIQLICDHIHMPHVARHSIPDDIVVFP